MRRLQGGTVPLYEYTCRACQKQFELLVRKGDTPACPACASQDLEKMLSEVAIKSSGTHALALKAAKRRDAKQGAENARAQREYELSHDD
jgi:putative FmdB family regulatory protein